MAWQPSRVVPGLAQYLAAKRLAMPPPPTGAPNSTQLAAGPDHCDLVADVKALRGTPAPVLPSKRMKVDSAAQAQPSKSTASAPDCFHSDGTPVLALSAISSAKSIDDFLLDLPSLLRESLLPFQKEGIMFAINKGGRVLIGDDMGLGSKFPLLLLPLLFPPPPPPLPPVCITLSLSHALCRDASSRVLVLAAAQSLASTRCHARQHARCLG
jgi:hypothetical protein